MASCVWQQYRLKLAGTTALSDLVVRNRCYIKGYGLKFKVKHGVLVPHRYDR